MSFILINGRRMPERCLSAFRIALPCATSTGYLEARIYGKIEFIHFKNERQLRETGDYLVNRLQGFIKLDDWYVRKKDIREYKKVVRDSEGIYYIELVIPYMTNKKVRFSNEEDLNKCLLELDEQFDVK